MTPNRGRVSTLIIFSSLHAGQLEDDQFKTSNCFQTMIIVIIKSLMIEEPHGNMSGSKTLPLRCANQRTVVCACVILLSAHESESKGLALLASISQYLALL